VIGPVVAGKLLRADIFGAGWRMISGINLSLGVYVVAVGRLSLPEREVRGRRPQLDLPGVLLAAVEA
jgi:hypothetical protein